MPRTTRSAQANIATGARIALVRHALGLSQEALAAQLAIGRSAVANWEKGTREADVGRMTRLCELYGVTLDYIYRGSLVGLPHELYRAIEERQPEAAGLAEDPAPFQASQNVTKRR